MIRLCSDSDAGTIYEIINDSARAYEGRIPSDCYHQPYMPLDELLSELADGVLFYGYEQDGSLLAVMGIQDKGPVTLIRHAYTRTANRGQGIGSTLLQHLLSLTTKPVLIGTWRDATWAIRFYEKFGFRLVSIEEKNRLLRTYWSISQRQVDTSVVLRDQEPGLRFARTCEEIVAIANRDRQEDSDGEPGSPRLLTVQEIQALGLDWPKYALIEQYVLMEGERVDLSQTIERMQSSRAFYRKQINDAYAFKQQTGADYADFTERFDDIVRMESELARSIDYLEQILVAAAPPER